MSDPLCTPAATPASLIEQLNREIVRTLANNAVKEKLFKIGFEPVGSPASGLLAGVKADTAKWGKLIREAGLRAD